MNEDFLAWVWRHRMAHEAWLEPEGCPPLRLIYPGTPQGGRGPDFRGALLATRDERLVRGDVEVHLRGSDWAAHGHHRDPAYNAVALHVLWEADRAELARRADGRPVPQLALRGCLPRPLEQLQAEYRA